MDAKNLNSSPHLCEKDSPLNHLSSLFEYLFSTKVSWFPHEVGDFLASLSVPLGHLNSQDLRSVALGTISDPRLALFIGATCCVPLINGIYWPDWAVWFLVACQQRNFKKPSKGHSSIPVLGCQGAIKGQ